MEFVETKNCTFCGEQFKRKSDFFSHLKEFHKIPQPYQCTSCSKRYSTDRALCRHRHACKGTYSLTSFMKLLEYAIPIFGDRLACVADKSGGVVAVYADVIVGQIQEKYIDSFIKFIKDGTIIARIAGMKNYRGEVVVEYIFSGKRKAINELISEI